jgi:hypothetical protein
MLAVGAAATAFALAVVFGARAAGGADTAGYLSQAYLWLEGDLFIGQPLSTEVPWPHGRQSLTPLGYAPGGNSTAVPVYSPGLPLILAAVIALLGDCAPYFVPPAFAALLVWATFWLGSRLTGDSRGSLIATGLMLSAPTFLFNIMTLMSDTACAAFWTLALAFAAGRTRRSAAAAGLACGLAVLVRPNLAPAALVVAAAAESWRPADAPRWRRAAMILAGVAPAALLVGAVNNALYGSPLLSGYGPTRSLYSVDHLWTNVRQFGTWLLQSEGAVLWPLALVLVIGRSAVTAATVRRLVPLLAFGAAIVVAYLFYLPFDAWWFLRFLLPAFPVLFITIGVAMSGLFSRTPSPLLRTALGALLLTAAVTRLAPYWTEIRSLGRHEQRYAAVGAFVDTALPANAAVLSMQHSSSIRFYSGRMIVRYDAFSAARFESAVEWLQARGFHPYLVLDDAEVPDFTRRFATTGPTGRLDVRLVGEWTAGGRVRVYDVLAPPAAGDVFPIVPRPAQRCLRPHPNWSRDVR